MPTFVANILAGRLNRFLFVLLVISLISSGFYAYHSATQIIEPRQWYFWTAQNFGPDAKLPNHKIIIEHELNAMDGTSALDPLGVCDIQAVTSLANRGFSPPGVGYKDVWLCNNALATPDEFDEQVSHFKEKVDELYAAYHYEIVQKIITSFVNGFLVWASVVFSAFTVKWIKKGKKI